MSNLTYRKYLELTTSLSKLTELMKYEKLYIALKVDIIISEHNNAIALLIEECERVKTEHADQPDDVQSDVISSMDEIIHKKKEFVKNLKNDTMNWDEYFYKGRPLNTYKVYHYFGDL